MIDASGQRFRVIARDPDDRPAVKDVTNHILAAQTVIITDITRVATSMSAAGGNTCT